MISHFIPVCQGGAAGPGLTDLSGEPYNACRPIGEGRGILIAQLAGTLISRNESAAIVEVGGVGFEIELPASTTRSLPPDGEQVTFHTFLLVREDEIRLFGFATQEEKQLFQILNTLQRVGVRTALDILSALTVEDFRAAVVSENAQVLTQVPGVGKKTAERIIFELKERLDELPIGAGEAAIEAYPLFPSGEKYEQAVQAMVSLGTRLTVAQRAVRKAYEQLGGDASLEDLIREGLRHRSAS